MIAFFANIFGYVHNFLYELLGNYGWAIILFSILIKILMLPISIKQQKTMQASQKINKEMKQIQFKYKNDPEKANQEVMELYKREKISPFSGCFSAIIQIILLFSVFYLVRSPLTYMKKVNPEIREKLENVVSQEGNISNYKEIAIINYVNNMDNEEDEGEESEKNEEDEEISELQEYKDDVYINMQFMGLDLSKVPTENLSDLKVLVIPILYVVSSFISLRMTTNNTVQNKEKKELNNDKSENNEEYDPMADANKSMSWIMPLMSISIACIAPLGLALYWLMNNILMIFERILLKKIIKEKEEANENA